MSEIEITGEKQETFTILELEIPIELQKELLEIAKVDIIKDEQALLEYIIKKAINNYIESKTNE